MMNKYQDRIVFSVFCWVVMLGVVREGNVTCSESKINISVCGYPKVLAFFSSTLLFCKGCGRAQVMISCLNAMMGSVLHRHYRK